MDKLLSQCTATGHNAFFTLYYRSFMNLNGSTQGAHDNVWGCLGNFVITIQAGNFDELDPDLGLLLAIILEDCLYKPRDGSAMHFSLCVCLRVAL